MKKLNNRQNQVKSLDFQQNILFNFNQQQQQQQQNQQQYMLNTNTSGQLSANIAHHQTMSGQQPLSGQILMEQIRSPQIIKQQQQLMGSNNNQSANLFIPNATAPSFNQDGTYYKQQQILSKASLKNADSQKSMKNAFVYSQQQQQPSTFPHQQPAQAQTRYLDSGKTLNQVDSSQSLQAQPTKQQYPPVFMDMPKTNGGGSNTMAVTSSNVTGNKKVSTKATKIKIGMHKKAVSIAQNQVQGISATTTTALFTKNTEHHNNSVMHQTQQPQLSNIASNTQQMNEMVMFKQQATLKNTSNSRKKTMGGGSNSGGHSKQPSITSQQQKQSSGGVHEYNSSNNNNIIVMNYGGDVQIFPKIDNFIIGNSPEKKGDNNQRTPTTSDKSQKMIMESQQQQLMQMKNYQRIINEAAQSSAHHLKANAKNNSAQKLLNNSDKKQKNQLQESQNQQQMQILKASFDSNSRPPLGHHVSSSTTGNPSQRISIISSLLGEESQAQDIHQAPQLHTNMNLQTNVASRAQVHFQQPQQPASMPIKNPSSSTIQAQMKQIQGKYMKDQQQDILLSAMHQSPHSHLFMSASQANTNNGRQIKKSLQHHHQRTFSDVPTSVSGNHQQAMLQHSNLLNGKNPNILSESSVHHHPIATTGTVNSNRGMTEQLQQSHGLSSMQSYEDNKHSSETRQQQQQQHNEYQQHRKIVKNHHMPHMQSIDASLQHNKNSLLGAMQNSGFVNSSRQNHSKTQSSVQQQHLQTDERDVLLQMLKNSSGHHQQSSPSMHSSTEIKNIYSGLLKDQLNKTKQHTLKLTQSQFGVAASGNGQSRKVVQSAANKLNGSTGNNTQSFRISQQGILTQMTNPSSSNNNPGHMSQMSKDSAAMMLMTAGINSLQKMTPKIQLSKTKKHTKQPSINNNSSAGARGSGNATKIQNPIISNNTGQMIYLNDAKLQKVLLQNSQSRDVAHNTQKNLKAIYSAAVPTSHLRSESMGNTNTTTGYDINLQGAMADIMARTSTKAALMSTLNVDQQQQNHNNFLLQAAAMAAGQRLHATHKRSVSDGNTIFQSLMSGRGANNANGPSQNVANEQMPPGQIYKSTNVSSKKQKSSGKGSSLLTGQQHSHSLSRPTPPIFPPGMIIPQQQQQQELLLRSTFHKDNSLNKISAGPYDQILVLPQNVVNQQQHNLFNNQDCQDRPQSGIRMNSYAMNPSSHRSQQSNNTNKVNSHRQQVEERGSNRLRSAKNPLAGHARNHSHQITLGDTHHHQQQVAMMDNQGVSTALPRPPTTSGKLKNPHYNHRRDSSTHKMPSGGGNNGEIVIEDQGVPTPNHHKFSGGTPRSLLDNSDQVVFDIGSAKQQQKAKNKSSLQTKKKETTQSRRQSMERRTAKDLQISQDRYDTQDSVLSDPNLSPRARKNMKLARIVRLAFKKTSNPPVTSSDFYKVGKVMGKGAFGKVNLAIHRLSGKFVALKSINKTFLSEEASKRKVMQEFNILQRTRHRNIVRLYESFETPQHIVFVMEVCGAGDLLTYVRRRRKLKEEVAKHLFKQIVEGLKYCHSKGILHRDIKLDNILLTSEGDIKICDFGVSKLTKHGENMKEQCGTPAYIAPEVFEGQGYEGYASDIWSAGVVLYAMLYGTVPFKASNMTELQRQICKGSTSFKDEISAESIQLLTAILEKDPKKRLSINEILRHPWMQNIPKNINVFTDQEKEKVNQEFAYYNMKADNNQGDGENNTVDPFAEHMSLNSTQNSLVKNVSTKSVILAPFNSTRTHIDENFHNHDSIQDLMVDKRVIKFAAKVKEVDRQYEANNNAELDNGVYHQDDEEEKNDQQVKSPPIGSNDEYQLDGGLGGPQLRQDDDQLQREIEKGQKLKDQSEWQKIERMMINKQRNEDESKSENQMNQLLAAQQQHTQNLNMVIDQQVLSEIEMSGGFPRLYTTNCLQNDDLNYATAYYYLLCTIKEY